MERRKEVEDLRLRCSTLERRLEERSTDAAPSPIVSRSGTASSNTCSRCASMPSALAPSSATAPTEKPNDEVVTDLVQQCEGLVARIAFLESRLRDVDTYV